MPTVTAPSSQSAKIMLQSGLREPASCSSQGEKVRNLLALSQSLQLSLQEVERQRSFDGYVAASFAFLGFVRATSLVILDLTGNLGGNTPAGKVAKMGKLAVINAETVGDVLNGSFKAGKAVERLATSSASMLPGDHAKFVAGKAVSTAAMGAKAANGELDGKGAAKYGAGQTLGGLSYAFKQGDASDQKIGKGVAAVKSLVDYGFELEKTLSEHTRFLDESKQRAENARKMFSRQLRRLEQQINAALRELARCVEEHKGAGQVLG